MLGIMLLFFFFEIIATIPNIGYVARVNSVRIEDVPGNPHIRNAMVNCSITYNPFLYPFSWTMGNGWFADKYCFLSYDELQIIGEEKPYMHYQHLTTKEIVDTAIGRLFVEQFNAGFLFNLVLFIVIALLRVHDLYVCMLGGVAGFILGGTIGFAIGALIGSFVMFFAVVLIAIIVRLRSPSKEDLFTQLWKFLLEEDQLPYETPRW